MRPLAIVWFVSRRLLFLALILAVVSVLIFSIVQLLPGDVATMILGTSGTAEDVEALRVRLGLNRPVAIRYVEWITGALRGDWGTSLLYQVPVRPLVLDRLARSGVLALMALVVAVPLSVLLGVISAVRRDRAADKTIGGFTLVAVSLPEFVTGTALILLLAYWLPLFPPSSLVDRRASLISTLPALVLPTMALVLAMLAHMTRMTRASMLDALEQPYVQAARIRGLPLRSVIMRHALRNALLPTVGIVALNVGYLMGGIVVVEVVFAYPGMGRLLVDAINHRDVPVIQMASLVTATVYAVANLVADLIYAYLDPRIRY